MSQPPDNEKVTKNNERLFSIYENHLRSPNVKDYTETAAKLTVWLGNSKAYYTIARPMIVRLLIIAQMTLRGAVGYSLDISVPFMPSQWLDHPLTASYVMLIQATRPFRDLFVETPLKNAVSHLLQAVEGIPLVPVPQTTPSQQTPSPRPSPDPRTENHPKEAATKGQTTGLVSSQGSQTVQAHDSNTGTAPTLPAKGQPTLDLSQHSIPGQASLNSSTSDMPHTAKSQGNRSPEITFIGISHKDTTGSHGAASSAPARGNQSSVSSSRQGVRSKKLRKIDLSAFVESDIQDFKQKQAQVQRGIPDPVQIKKEVEPEEISLKIATQPSGVEGAESMASPLLSPPPAQTQHSPNQTQSLQEHAQPVPRLHPELISQPTSQNLGQSESSSLFTVSQTSQQEPKYQHASPIPSLQPKWDSSVRSAPGEARIISTDVPVPLAPLPPHTIDSPLAPSPPSVSMIVDHPSDPIGVVPTPKQLTEGSTITTLVPGVADNMPQPIDSVEMRPLLIPEDSTMAQFLKLYEKLTIPKPHPSVEIDATSSEVGESQQRVYVADDRAAFVLAKETPKTRFQVVAFSRGGTQDSSTEIVFDLTQSDMECLSKWVNNKASQLKDIASSYCLSLGCYSSRELIKRLGKQSHATIEAPLTEVVASMPSGWPQIGGVSMNVNFHGSRRDLPLAPPLITTVDGYVDLSEFAMLGKNSIIIHQEDKDVSDYTFVLHAHNPTLGQLQEIMRQRKSEVEWRDWLAGVTRPLHIDVPSLPPASS